LCVCPYVSCFALAPRRPFLIESKLGELRDKGMGVISSLGPKCHPSAPTMREGDGRIPRAMRIALLMQCTFHGGDGRIPRASTRSCCMWWGNSETIAAQDEGGPVLGMFDTLLRYAISTCCTPAALCYGAMLSHKVCCGMV
jgi:hypothetical protein